MNEIKMIFKILCHLLIMLWSSQGTRTSSSTNRVSPRWNWVFLRQNKLITMIEISDYYHLHSLRELYTSYMKFYTSTTIPKDNFLKYMLSHFINPCLFVLSLLNLSAIHFWLIDYSIQSYLIKQNNVVYLIIIIYE